MSDDSTPPNKRKRTEEVPQAALPGLVRSEIWMPFGDLILQAESTQFRVNRDVLARQSSVFADMFSVPQPPNEPKVEGCPIVILSDSAKDWELLLGVLYDPFPPNTMVWFPVLAAMLRLGRKYDIHKARDDAVRRIHFEYPDNVEAWDTSTPNFTEIEDSSAIHIDLLNLCLECGIYSSIPVLAWGSLSCHGLETMLTGVTRTDGTLASIQSVSFKVTLAIAFEKMLLFRRKSLRWLDTKNGFFPSASCTAPIACARTLRAIDAQEKSQLLIGICIDNWRDQVYALCQPCRLLAEEKHGTFMEEGWEAIQSFFVMPEWKGLKDLD